MVLEKWAIEIGGVVHGPSEEGADITGSDEDVGSVACEHCEWFFVEVFDTLPCAVTNIREVDESLS